MKEAKANPPMLAAHWLVTGMRPTADPVYSMVPLAHRLRWAQVAGYAGVGFSLAQLRADVAAHGAAGVRALLAEHGMRHVEMEALAYWWTDETPRRDLDEFLELGEQIGALHLKVTGDFSPTPPEPAQMADRFDQVVKIARGSGIAMALEIIAFSNIADLPSALHILGPHSGKGAGLMLDAWHFARRELPLEAVAALPAEVILGVEISDTGPTVMGSMIEDTIDYRRLPGEGGYCLDAFLDAVWRTGYGGPIGLEVLSRDLRALEVPEALGRCAAAAQRLFVGSNPRGFTVSAK